MGSCLRAFTFGHVRQLDAVAARFLVALAGLTRLLGAPASPATSDADPDADPGVELGYALLDVDDTIVEVHGHAKQGAWFGYSGVRGLNALVAVEPVIGRCLAPARAGSWPDVATITSRHGTTGVPMPSSAVRDATSWMSVANLSIRAIGLHNCERVLVSGGRRS